MSLYISLSPSLLPLFSGWRWLHVSSLSPAGVPSTQLAIVGQEKLSAISNNTSSLSLTWRRLTTTKLYVYMSYYSDFYYLLICSWVCCNHLAYLWWSHICSYHMTVRHGAVVSVVYNVPQIAQLVYHSYSISSKCSIISFSPWLVVQKERPSCTCTIIVTYTISCSKFSIFSCTVQLRLSRPRLTGTSIIP